MKSAKQVVFILIGAAMILLSVGLIFAKGSSDREHGISEKGENGSASFSVPISTLVFEAGACNIEILEGEGNEFFLDYEGLKYGTLTHNLDGDTLRISYKQDDDWVAKMFLTDDINDQRITLTIPKSAVLDEAEFEFGAADITMVRVVANELVIKVGAGELHADGLTATGQAKLNVGAGALYADDVNFANAELVCGVGEMEISGLVAGESVVDCGVGHMGLALDGEQEAYYGELDCGLGELRFGDIRIEGSGKKSYGTTSAECRMDIKCGIGEVDVQFYN